ncbi:hypothetical protein HG537_0B04110 [Torulaspora globosa]|uniref:Reverse transcriptase/retrotransposon-derived protein RNase H-like domain-containing protein n=1 Tax=Torulaspora globosa TaxID=48254 RepID=A0A7H9HMR0_9SACH|nr:hypothetical protein HG537_0B04110 [Torulaspora sp. CBS 2947]
MINYYRRFISRCSIMARPLIELTAKRTQCTMEQTNAFNDLKRALVSASLLVPFSPERVCRLTTDASKLGIGAVFEQLINNRLSGVVGYFSKSLQGVRNNYPAGELEQLGIIENLRHFKYLLHGKRFKRRTDHISLLALKNRSEPPRRLARWLDELGRYDIDLEYLGGPDNVVADTLSRNVPVKTLETIPALDPSA